MNECEINKRMNREILIKRKINVLFYILFDDSNEKI